MSPASLGLDLESLQELHLMDYIKLIIDLLYHLIQSLDGLSQQGDWFRASLRARKTKAKKAGNIKHHTCWARGK
jgi:hypothetical protein